MGWRTLQMHRVYSLFSVRMQSGKLVGSGTNWREIERVAGKLEQGRAAQRVLRQHADGQQQWETAKWLDQTKAHEIGA